MDSVTQAILGGAIAELGFRERLGNKAVIFGTVCGLVPDLDIIIHWHSEWAYIIHHRGFSHSFLVLAFLTPILAWFGYLWAQKASAYLSWCHLTFWALFTHPLLDLFTSFGTQIFWPFSNTRFAWDGIAIIDLFYTIPLLLAIIVGCISKFSFRFRRYFAICMFLMTTAYLLLGYANSQEAIQLVRQQLDEQENGNIKVIRAIPTLSNIHVWRIVIQHNDNSLSVGLISTSSPQEIQLIQVPHTNNALTQQVMYHEYGKIFTWFAMDLVTAEMTTAADGTMQVYLHDQRYASVSHPDQNIFSACFSLDADGKIQSVQFVRRQVPMDLLQEWKATWAVLTGNNQES